MGRMAEVMRGSRNAMLNEESKQSHDAVLDYFGIRDGDIIECWRNSNRGPIQTTARILSCDSCWYNQRAGYTASITVLPLLTGGRLGCSKQILIATKDKSIIQIGVRGEDIETDYEIRKIKHDSE